MNKKKQKLYTLSNLISNTKEAYFVFVNELKTIFRDRGVVIILIIAPIIYPLLYCSIYKNETLRDVPVAVVNDSKSDLSRQLLRNLDASPDVKIENYYLNIDEAKKAFDARKVNGVVYIPAEFDKKIKTQQQATISVYCDMSSFMYYRALMMGSNYSVLDMNRQIQLERLNSLGVTGENATIQSDPIGFEDNILFNEGMGFTSFLMPAVLILILHQTLFFGISMVAGTAREENRFHTLVSSKFNRRGIYRVVFGKAMCYFLIYLIWLFFTLIIIPKVFNLPHIGNSMDVFKFMMPFLLATIFFSMTLSVFFPNRETSMIVLLFFSLILLFLSGISWPMSNINWFWRGFGWLFPATHGIQGYIKINSMGGDLHSVKFDYLSLWIQTAFYFITASLAYTWQMRRKGSEENEDLVEIG